ncbi:MAG: deoxyribose-phosphate aldolase [Planctomycetota bacterium]|nr:MAG: deoxyribose-phosphate aldolase [Planctomycetota bacterium]
MQNSPSKYPDIAKTLDHSLLQPFLTDAEMIAGCELAKRYDVASVCIKPSFVALAKSILRGTTVAVGTTIGFPHGGHRTDVKVFESECALNDGATELDMVVNLGDVLAGHFDRVQADIAAVVNLAHNRGAIVKVIFENCYLKPEHIKKLCQICTDVGADFVKTSTGYGTGGATLEDLKLMRASCPINIGVKAAGGVRDLDKAIEVIGLGVTRIGASATAAILDDWRSRLGLPPMETVHGAALNSTY